MWRECGLAASRIARVLILAAPLAALAPESAGAGLLKNSVRVGDRSAMHILRVPAPGERRRIRRGRPPAPRAAPARPALGWFWRELSDRAADASPARWAAALASVEARRRAGGALYTAREIDAIARRWRAQIAAAARRHDLSEALILAVIAVESAGEPRAVSPKGARGLMQLVPATARRFAVADSFDPAANIRGGAAYLDWLLAEFRGDPILALAGYNAGEAAVAKHRGVPPFAETRDYVVKVFDALAAARPLCPALAEGPRARCGWAPGRAG